MRIANWFRPSPVQSAAGTLYQHIVERARDPAFYGAYGVPDSLDGRFEMLALHAFVVMHRLKRDGAATASLAQALFDTMFADLDRSLREIGVSDLAVGKRIKEMARGFYGRSAAYAGGIAGDPAALEQALARNVYGTAAPPPRPVLQALAEYLCRANAAFETLSTTALGEARDLPWPAIAPIAGV